MQRRDDGFLALIATLAVLLYISTRDRLPACELRRTLDQVRANTRTIEKTLQQQRPVLNDAHKHISGVTKALQKPAPQNPLKSRAGCAPSRRLKTCTF